MSFGDSSFFADGGLNYAVEWLFFANVVFAVHNRIGVDPKENLFQFRWVRLNADMSQSIVHIGDEILLFVCRIMVGECIPAIEDIVCDVICLEQFVTLIDPLVD